MLFALFLLLLLLPERDVFGLIPCSTFAITCKFERRVSLPDCSCTGAATAADAAATGSAAEELDLALEEEQDVEEDQRSEDQDTFADEVDTDDEGGLNFAFAGLDCCRGIARSCKSLIAWRKSPWQCAAMSSTSDGGMLRTFSASKI